jgi:hypothetical protein
MIKLLGWLSRHIAQLLKKSTQWFKVKYAVVYKIYFFGWVIEWVCVVSRQMSKFFFQLYRGENKIHFGEMMMMSVLY